MAMSHSPCKLARSGNCTISSYGSLGRAFSRFREWFPLKGSNLDCLSQIQVSCH